MSEELKKQEALSKIDEILSLTNEAKSKFKSARNWGIFDIFGGGLIADLFKHSNLNSVKSLMERISCNLEQLHFILGTIIIPEDYRMNMNGFITFADFVFDDIFFSTWMTFKIISGIDQVNELENKLLTLKTHLESI